MLDPDDPKPQVRTEMTKAHLSGEGVSVPSGWIIDAHSFDDNNTGMRFEFLHVDGQPVLQVYSNLRDKVVRFLFETAGKLIHSDIRPFPDPAMHVGSPEHPEEAARTQGEFDPGALGQVDPGRYPTEPARVIGDYHE